MNISSYMAQELQSLQQTISMSTMKKAMNQDTQAMSTLLNGFVEANPPAPVPVGEVGHNFDTYA